MANYGPMPRIKSLGDDTWKALSACADEPKATFYPPFTQEIGGRPRRGESVEDKRLREEGAFYAEARAICSNCPVADDCLEFALANREEDGFWGNKAPRERKSIIRRRERQALRERERDLVLD